MGIFGKWHQIVELSTSMCYTFLGNYLFYTMGRHRFIILPLRGSRIVVLYYATWPLYSYNLKILLLSQLTISSSTRILVHLKEWFNKINKELSFLLKMFGSSSWIHRRKTLYHTTPKTYDSWIGLQLLSHFHQMGHQLVETLYIMKRCWSILFSNILVCIE